VRMASLSELFWQAVFPVWQADVLKFALPNWVWQPVEEGPAFGGEAVYVYRKSSCPLNPRRDIFDLPNQNIACGRAQRLRRVSTQALTLMNDRVFRAFGIPPVVRPPLFLNREA